MATPLRIIGQGLAGTILAWRCEQLGQAYTIEDDDRGSTASKVAAGLVTPVTGQRLARTIGWDWHTDMLAFYDWVSTQLGESHYQPRPMRRLLASASEQAVVQKRLADPLYEDILTTHHSAELPDCLHAPHGSVCLPNAGLLQCTPFIQASRSHFQKLNRWRTSKDDWLRDSSTTVVLCQGPWLLRQAGFDWLPLRFSHGDILTLSIPELDAAPGARDSLYAQKGWLIPDGLDRWRAGSTYAAVSTPDTRPSPDGRAEIEHLTRLP